MANLPSIVTDYVVESVRWKRVLDKVSRREKSARCQGRTEQMASLRGNVWLIVVDDEKCWEAQKVGGLVRLIKGKAESGTGELGLGLRFDVRGGKEAIARPAQNKWGQRQEEGCCDSLSTAAIRWQLTGTGHWWASTQQVTRYFTATRTPGKIANSDMQPPTNRGLLKGAKLADRLALRSSLFNIALPSTIDS